MKLSTHFTLAELTRSETAARHDIDLSNPPADVLGNLVRLATLVLEPIRREAGTAIVVTSGWRPKRLNDLVGGAPNSDHIYGRAADIHAVGMGLAELEQVIRRIAPVIGLQTCIREFGQWLHVSVVDDLDADHTPQFLVASRENGRTMYADAYKACYVGMAPKETV